MYNKLQQREKKLALLSNMHTVQIKTGIQATCFDLPVLGFSLQVPYRVHHAFSFALLDTVQCKVKEI